MPVINPYIIAFAVTLGLSLMITPLVIKLAFLIGAIDKPNQRKVHKIPTPRLGGVAIFISFFGGLFTLAQFYPDSVSSLWISTGQGFVIFGALLFVLCLGIWDDIRPLKAGPKFLVQLAVSIFIYINGFQVSSVTNIFGSGTTSLGIFDFPLTVLWIVGVTNALNLIDGLDGLASGVALIAALTIFPIALLQGDPGTAVLLLLLAAALLGFLKYNFNPAKIFLGDSGSLFLGFILAVLALKSSTKSSTGFALLVPILALGLPIMDTLLSMIRRFLRSFSDDADPEKFIAKLKSLFQPDSSHIHHRLIGRGFSHKKVVLLLYIVSIVLGLGAFAITVSTNRIASLILLVAGAAAVIGVRQLKYKEMAVLHNGILLPLYDKPIMNRQSFQVFFDLAAIIISILLAQELSGWMEFSKGSENTFIALLSTMTAVQLAVFWFSGMYKRTFQILGIGDSLQTIKGILFSVIATGVVLNIIAYPVGHQQLGALVIDFFFLSLFVFGIRMSLQVLQYFSLQGERGGKKVVLYGADPNGALMLERMTDPNIPSWTPIGLLDDNPALMGKIFNGYPVFGSHWNLRKLITKQTIDEIVLCSDTIKPEALRRVRDIAEHNNISMKRMRIFIEDLGEDKIPQAVVQEYQLDDSHPTAGKSGSPNSEGQSAAVLEYIQKNNNV